nr:Lrp/AsnC ligand binding domain-containing protein [Pseudofrankia sp. DC12]
MLSCRGPATGQVSECYRITGEDCFLLMVHAPSVEGLQPVLDRSLGYGQTVSSIVVSTPVPARPLPLRCRTTRLPEPRRPFDSAWLRSWAPP